MFLAISENKIKKIGKLSKCHFKDCYKENNEKIKNIRCEYKNNCNDYEELGIRNIVNNGSIDELLIVMAKFLEHFAQDTTNDKKYYKLLKLAITLNNFKKLKLMIDCYTDIGIGLDSAYILYKAAKYGNIKIFQYALYRFQNGNNYDTDESEINLILKNANKNKNIITKEYINFIFKNYEPNDLFYTGNISGITLIFDHGIDRGIDDEDLNEIKMRQSVFINNHIINNLKKKIINFNNLINNNNVLYFNVIPKDIVGIIKTYLVDYDIESHFLSYCNSCVNGNINLEKNVLLELENLSNTNNIINYNSKEISIPDMSKMCSVCLVKFIENY